MRRDLVEIVCCPVHKTRLELDAHETDEHDDVVQGVLRCEECGFDYPVEDGIPNLLPPEYHDPDRAVAEAAETAESE